MKIRTTLGVLWHRCVRTALRAADESQSCRIPTPRGHRRWVVLVGAGLITSMAGAIDAYAQTFTYTDYTAAISLDVPSAEFYFHFGAGDGTTCSVSLSYYLTWA